MAYASCLYAFYPSTWNSFLKKLQEISIGVWDHSFNSIFSRRFHASFCGAVSFKRELVSSSTFPQPRFGGMQSSSINEPMGFEVGIGTIIELYYITSGTLHLFMVITDNSWLLGTCHDHPLLEHLQIRGVAAFILEMRCIDDLFQQPGRPWPWMLQDIQLPSRRLVSQTIHQGCVISKTSYLQSHGLSIPMWHD